MPNLSLQTLLAQRAEVLESIRQIQETCEGVENPENAQKVNELTLEKARLMSDQTRLKAELVGIEQALNQINENICSLSAGIDKILDAIKTQRWFFFKNKPKVVFDRLTAYLWANLDYFAYCKPEEREYQYSEAKSIIESLQQCRYAPSQWWYQPPHLSLWVDICPVAAMQRLKRKPGLFRQRCIRGKRSMEKRLQSTSAL